MTKIEWTDKTWNPIVGCTKVSPGCAHCYAERMAKRLKAMGQPEYQNAVDDKGRWTGRVTLVPERLGEPLKWRKPSRVFVNSMSDLFHPSVPLDLISRVFDVMSDAKQHTFQVLTKRPERMLEWIEYDREYPGTGVIVPPNVWLGVSVENQAAADERIPLLLDTPAAVRFVSAEPLLGPVDLQLSTWFRNPNESKRDLPPNGIGLNWVIVGCESGPHARLANLDWFRSLRDQCSNADVPFFLKQAVIDGRLTKLPELDGKQWIQYPQA